MRQWELRWPSCPYSLDTPTRAVVEVQVNAADRIGEVARYTMRKNKPPSSVMLCTAPGSIQPKATC